MSVSLILTVLKYTGTAISGAAGIWGTVNETRDKKTGQLTTWGKWALGLAIAGFVVAVSSQIAGQINDEREANETAAAHQKEVSDLQRQLQGNAISLDREATRFDTIMVWLEYELPMTDQRVKTLAADLERLGASLPEGGRPTGGLLRQEKKMMIVPEQFNPQSIASFAPLTEFFTVANRSLVLIAINKHRQPGESAPGPQMHSADLYADINSHRTTNQIPILSYYLQSPSRLTLLLPYSEFKEVSWHTNEKIIGIPDLSEAEVKFQVIFRGAGDKNVSSIISSAHLVGGSIRFGKHQCALRAITTKDSRTTTTHGETMISYDYSTVLPSADVILGR